MKSYSSSDTTRELARWRTVQAIAESLNSLDLDQTLLTVRNALVQTAGYDRAGIQLLDPDDPSYLRGTWGTAPDGSLADEHTRRTPVSDHPNSSRILRGEVPYVLRNTDFPERPSSASDPPQHAIVPLKSSDETFGVLSVDNLITQRPLDEDDIHFLRLVAGHAALAIVKAQAHERRQRETRETTQALEDRVLESSLQLKEAQEQLVRSEQLAVIGQLTAAIAHELRNPLGVINNATFLLNLKIKDPDEKIAQALNTLRNQVKVCESIINRFLDFSKESRPILRPSRWQQAVKFALDSMPLRPNVEVLSEVESTLSPVPMDMELMSRVISNLVQNASQITSISGHRGVVRIEAGQGEKTSWLAVSDNGPGVTEEDRERIYEPFYTTRPNGIGLGLSLVKRIVESHGGHIDVGTSTEGGARFTVHLPLEPADAVSLD